jgi:hypothetical protein
MPARYSPLVVPWILLLVLIHPHAACGQTAPTFPLAGSQLWEFGLWGGEAVGKRIGEAFGETQITMAGFHLGRVVYEHPDGVGGRRTLEYTIELQPVFLVTRPQQAYGGGFSPVGVKWNFVPRGRYRTYMEFNGGGMFTQKNVPRGDTSSFNFTVGIGPGVMIATGKNQALSIALRYWHLSNANLGNENPSFNTVQIEVGYHWLKARGASRKMVSGASTSSPTTQ